ncbi:unnamed protein product, partial [Pleuronectes platessa]
MEETLGVQDKRGMKLREIKGLKERRTEATGESGWTGGGLVAETWTMGREGLWFVSVPLSKAPYSPNICSPSA